MENVRKMHGVNERHTCRVLKQWRGTHCYGHIHRNDFADVMRRAERL